MEGTKARAKGRKDDAEKTAGAPVPLETEGDGDGDPLEETLLRPQPPVKSRSRGGTGIGRDLDH